MGGPAVVPLSAVNSHDTFTGDAFVVSTKTAAGTGFDMISAKANNVEVFKVDGSGAAVISSTLDTGGSTTGSLVTAGGVGIAKDLQVGATIHATNVRGTNAYQQISDERFKTDIKQLEESLDTLKRIRGVRFRFRVDDFPERGSKKSEQTGFIAQEVEEVFPEMVTTDKDGWKTVAYGTLVPHLVEAVKTQDKRIKTQDKRIRELQEQLDDLRRALAAAGLS